MKRNVAIFIAAILLAAYATSRSLTLRPIRTATKAAAQDSCPPIPPEQLKADLDYLFKTIEEVHVNMYAYISREEFTDYRDALCKRIDQPMNQIEFYKLVAPVVAQIKNSHTNVMPCGDTFQAFLSRGGKMFPLEIRWDDEKPLIARDFGQTEVPLGGQILKIAGEDAATVLGQLASRFGSDTKSTSPQMLQMQGFLAMQLWFEYGPVDSLVLTVRGLDQQTKDYNIPFVTGTEVAQVWARQAVTQEKWTFRVLPDGSAGVLTFNSCTEPEKLRDFLNDVFAQLRDRSISNLIIDIRRNPGGHDPAVHVLTEFLRGKPTALCTRIQLKVSAHVRASESVDSICKALGKPIKDGQVVTVYEAMDSRPRFELNPNKYKGRIFLLIGPNTCSAATALAGLFKAGGIATLVGEETSDTVACHGAAYCFRMPNSQLSFNVPCKYIQVYGGKADGHGVLPDYEVKQTAQDTARGVDTVMEYALGLAKSAPPRASSQPASRPVTSARQD